MSAVVVPRLAALRYEKSFDVSTVLSQAIARLRKQGITVGGLLQEAESGGSEPCAILQVVDLRSGQKARITQNRGKEARGCKLDEQGLVALSHCLDQAIDDRVDLVVVSRFGRAEAAGGGLLASFTAAVCAGVPLLTAVREPYLERWAAFHGGLAVDLPPSVDAVLSWFYAHAQTSAMQRNQFAESASSP